MKVVTQPGTGLTLEISAFMEREPPGVRKSVACGEWFAGEGADTGDSPPLQHD